jgi:dCMP deaminase
MNWDEFFINICYTVAKKSKDRSTQVGCVVVGPDQEIRSTGFNGLPRGVIDKPITGHNIESLIPQWAIDRVVDACPQTNDMLLKKALEATNNEIEERYEERPYKYKWVAHAEFNAVCHAARTGVSLKGCKLYVPWLPCSNCAMAIIQAGITEVIMDGDFKEDPALMERWKDEHDITKMMFQEAGINVRKSQKKEN